MAMSLSELRKQRGSFESLQKEVEKLSNKPQSSDDRFWYPETDQAGNGSAVIRFLPAPKGEDFPWVRQWSHGFKAPTGKWFMEKCPTTLGNSCPVCERNGELYNTGLESDKKLAGERKRKLTYITNILVVSDPKNPQNEGKVFLFRFGKKIFDKIKDIMNPEFDDETPTNPFDFWEGANFKLKIRRFEGYQNYDKSEFAGTSAIADDDDEIEAIWNKQYQLQEFLAPNLYKPYDELKKKMDQVLAGTSSGAKAEDFDTYVKPDSEPKKEPKKEEKKVEAKKPAVVDEDDDENYFAALAAED